MSTTDQIDRLKALLEQLDLAKYASLSDILNTVFESGEKFSEFIDSLNSHIAQEENIAKKLKTLYDYISELPSEADIEQVVPLDKLAQVVAVVEKHVKVVEDNNTKAGQLDTLYKTINDSYSRLKKEADDVESFMTSFKTSVTYLTRYQQDKPVLNLVDMDSSFNNKIDTVREYAPGTPLKFLEAVDGAKPMVFYTPAEFVRGYIRNTNIVVDKDMEFFRLFSSEPETYDIGMINSLLPLEDSPEEKAMYSDVEFEVEIYMPGQTVPVTTGFTYYNFALGVTLYPGSKFRVVYKKKGADATVVFKFPKLRKLRLRQVKAPAAVPV